MSKRGEAPAKARPGRREVAALTVGVFAFLASAAVAAAFGFSEAAVASGLVGVFVAAVGVALPRRVSFRAAAACAGIATVGLFVAEASAGKPVLAGLAMGLVCLLTSLSKAAGKLSSAAGMILGTAYFLPAAIGLVDGIGAGDVGLVGLSGLAGGLVVLIGVKVLRRFRERGKNPSGQKQARVATERSRDSGPSGFALMWRELRSGGGYARSGLRRGILLGLIMGLYQVNLDHNLFWIMLTMYVVLQPDLQGTMSKAVKRSSGAVVGAVVVGGMSTFLPGPTMVAIGVAALLFGLTWYQVNYSIYAACVTILAVAINGEASGSFLEFAGLRIVDTAIGVTIALVAAYVLFPVKAPGRELSDAT